MGKNGHPDDFFFIGHLLTLPRAFAANLPKNIWMRSNWRELRGGEKAEEKAGARKEE